MNHKTEVRVYYADTDSYGVAWHGTYVRWLEASRTEFCDKVGLNLKILQEKGIVFPVVEMNLRYKSPALLFDELIIETDLLELKPSSMTFEQVIKNKETGKINLVATVKVVTIDDSGKLIRKIPDFIEKAFYPSLAQSPA